MAPPPVLQRIRAAGQLPPLIAEGRRGRGGQTLNSETPNPETLNLDPETWTLNPETWNLIPESGVLNPEPTLKPQPRTLNSEP